MPALRADRSLFLAKKMSLLDEANIEYLDGMKT